MKTMKAAQITKAGGDFEIVEREIPQPGAGQVRIRVQACGVCHSDVFVKDGGWPGLEYPRVPGHEIAGVIDEVGAGVIQWKTGQRVGVGWHGGQDGTCLACRRGDFSNCVSLKVTGISYDGGYEEYMVAPVEAVAGMPESLDAAEAAPLLCAGVTTFNALRHSGALPSDLVAVEGIGGLGHLGVQFAQKFSTRSRPLETGRAAPSWRRSSARMSTSTARRPTPLRSCRSWAVRVRSSRPPRARRRCPRSSTGLARTAR